MTDPYGSWPSPVTAAMVASAGVDFGHVALDGSDVYWLERRPDEGGRGVVVRATADGHEDVTPADANVRTLVHEYGGGDFTVDDGTVVYAGFEDQRLYRVDADDDSDADTPEVITPEPETERGLRYADLAVHPDGEWCYCVRENHDVVAAGDDRDDADSEEPRNSLVRLPIDGSDDPRVIARGHDFYAAPRPSPDGSRLAWLTWDHPRMPWDGTHLHVADVAADGTLSDERVVAGGADESVFQPDWSPDGRLHAVSDRSGWWNVYDLSGGEPDPIVAEDAEYGVPQWVFGLATFAFLDDGRVATLVTRDGERHLELVGEERTVADLPYATYAPVVRSDGRSLVLPAGGPTTPERVVRWAPGGTHAVLRESASLDVDDSYISSPEHVTFETRDSEERGSDGGRAHAYVYPPKNPDAEPPADEQPPLVVTVHGGPTGATQPVLSLSLQFFTSRGFAVADVDYRGSTGYGRAFREALYGEWGVRDVQDTIDAALHLADADRVDSDRLAVRGGSAGGFVVLSALAFHDAFDAGTSYSGVADLERLAALTHKFESRYLDQLVGPYPEAVDTYRERSPVHAAADIEVPVLLLQGADDPVVPLSQAEEMVDALTEGGVPHDLIVFEDEQHGFRSAAARERAHEAELAFYGQVFGFDPTDDVEPVDLA